MYMCMYMCMYVFSVFPYKYFKQQENIYKYVYVCMYVHNKKTITSICSFICTYVCV